MGRASASSTSSSSIPSSLSVTPSLSPDLGFVDCQEVGRAAPAAASPSATCHKKLPFVCLSTLKNSTLKAEVRLSAAGGKPTPPKLTPPTPAAEGSHRLPPILSSGPRGRYTATPAYPRNAAANRRFSPIAPAQPTVTAAGGHRGGPNAAATLLKSRKSAGKKVTVEIEKLPLTKLAAAPPQQQHSHAANQSKAVAAASADSADMFLMSPAATPRQAAQAAAKSRFVSPRTREISVPAGLEHLSGYRLSHNKCSAGGTSATITSAAASASSPSNGSAKSPTDTQLSINGSASFSFTPRTFYSNSASPLSEKSGKADNSKKFISESVSKISTPPPAALRQQHDLPCDYDEDSMPPPPTLSRACSEETSCSSLSTVSSSQESAASTSDPPSSAGITSAGSTDSASAGGGVSENGRPFRFPTLAGNTSAIPCKWADCGMGFKSHAKLSDHIKVEGVREHV